VNLPASSTYPYSATLTITNPGGQSANFTFQVTAPAGSFSISATYGYDELTALAAPGADVYNFPLISRNGNKIVFTVTSGNPAVNTVWGMNSGGSGLTMLDSDSAANPHFLSITDDGSKALVWSQNRIRLINTNGSGAATLVTVTGVPNGPGDALIHMAKITGDGSRIVFANGDIDNLTSGNNPQFIGGIYVINPDGTGLHSVVDTNSIANYLGLPAGSLRGFASLNGMDVSADGSKIVFRVTFALNGDYLIAVNQDGSGLHTIFGPITDVLTCGISGDGSTIWYNAIFAALAPNEIGTLPFGGGTRKALVSSVGNGGGGLATDLQLTANGSKLLVGDDGIGHLYNTDGSAAVSLFVTTNGVNGPVIGTNGDRLRITMDISASHFAYTVDARSLFPPVPQIALLTINQQSSGAGPVIANPSANPAYLVEKTASSTLIATITAPFAIGAVSAELLLPSGAFDGNSLNPVLAAGANNAYSGVMQGGFDGVTGPRTIRIQAEDTGADKRRHGSAVDFGPFNVVATAP